MQLPEPFIMRIKDLLGDDRAAFERALNEESPISIRLNPRKITRERLSFALPVSDPVPWAVDGYYLDSRPSFTSDPLFHAGCYYVQEASSMMLEHFVQTYFPRPAKVLDLCAAPGGKSTHLSALLPDESLLVANEVIRSRANVLYENLIKWGNPNTLITCNDPLEIGRSLPGFFDAIVADLPCSGEGMFRKDPAAVAEWSVNNVRLCAARQYRIVADIWQSLKPGGILIYSTCTYNREENEENLDRICCELNAELLEIPRRLMPPQIKGEGFFIAGIRKKESTSYEYPVRGKNEKKRTSGEKNTGFHTSPFARYLAFPDNFTYVSDNNRWTAVPSILFSDYLQVKNAGLKILSAGVTMGEIKGGDLIPAHDLAMSSALSETAFPQWIVNKETAWNYLRKNVFRNIPTELPEAYVLIVYKGHPLGFIKNIGTRFNNLYPQIWQIRKDNLLLLFFLLSLCHFTINFYNYETIIFPI